MKSTKLLQSLASAAVACILLGPSALGSDPYDGNLHVTSVAQAPNGGFWIQVNDTVNTGRTIVSGGAPVFESVNTPGTIVAVPGKNGYWVITKQGDIHVRGEAPPLCDGHLSKCSNYPSNPSTKEYVTGAAAAPDGGGFWALGREGQVWTVGTALPYGDAQGETAIVGTAIAATPAAKATTS